MPRQLQKCSESARYGIRARNKSNQNCNRKCGGNNKSAVKDQGMASEMDRIVPRRQQKYTECVRIPSSELELKVWGQLQNYSESVKYFLIGKLPFAISWVVSRQRYNFGALRHHRSLFKTLRLETTRCNAWPRTCETLGSKLMHK